MLTMIFIKSFRTMIKDIRCLRWTLRWRRWWGWCWWWGGGLQVSERWSKTSGVWDGRRGGGDDSRPQEQHPHPWSPGSRGSETRLSLSFWLSCFIFVLLSSSMASQFKRVRDKKRIHFFLFIFIIIDVSRSKRVWHLLLQQFFSFVTRAPLLYFIRSWVALSFKVCPSVRHPWHLTRSPLRLIYKGIDA